MNVFSRGMEAHSVRSVLVIGDVMLDVYKYGSVERISPEAPIPVLCVEDTREMLGGAGNVIANLKSLGCFASLIGFVGDDDNGRKIRFLLDELRCSDSFLFNPPAYATVSKTRFVSSNQQILRVDVDSKYNYTPESTSTVLDAIQKGVDRADVIILSDYNKGVLSPEICGHVIALANSRNIPVLVDPKGNDFSRYTNARLVKPNLKELKSLFSNEDCSGREIELARSLIRKYNVLYCLVTMGKDGMLLVSEKESRKFPAVNRQLCDISGAGDTVIATIAAFFPTEGSLDYACNLSNVAAGIAVGKPGTATVSFEEIHQATGANRKWFTDRERLTKQVQTWRYQGHTIGFTNGCFDLIHAGHIQTVLFAKQHCDRLIVAVNNDTSIRVLKGPDRPIIAEDERCLVLAQLEAIDALTIFSEATPEILIQLIKPDVIVKGGDYKENDVVGRSFVESYGGKVIIGPFVKELSTSARISRIKGTKVEFQH